MDLKDPKFLKLQAKWDKKLAKSGFVDIEHRDGRLKSLHNFHVDNPKRVFTQNGGWEAKQQYYIMAGQFLYSHNFDSKIEEAIWAYHANGLTSPQISKILKKARVKSVGTSYQNIWGIIDRLNKIMLGNMNRRIKRRNKNNE